MGLSKAYLIYKKYTLSIGIVIFISLLICCTNVLEEDPICIDGCINFEVIDYEPSWSPDGKWIAYYHVDSRTDYTGIYRIRPDGSENTFWIPGGQNPAWSPDSKWLAYSLGAQIWITELEGDSSEQLTFEGRNFSPNFEGFSSNLVYRRSYTSPEKASVQGIWILDSQTKEIRQVYSGNIGDPQWYNENEIISYRGVPDGKGSIRFDLLKIDVTSEQTNLLGLLSDPFHYLGYLRISTGKDRILFTANGDGPDTIVRTFLLFLAEKRKSMLLSNAYSSEWSPDSSKIVYTNSNVGNGRLHILDLVSNQSFQLTFENQFLTP